MANKPDQEGVSDASARRAKVPRELILHTMGCCTEPEHVGEYVYPTIAQEQIADSLLLELRDWFMELTQPIINNYHGRGDDPVVNAVEQLRAAVSNEMGSAEKDKEGK